MNVDAIKMVLREMRERMSRPYPVCMAGIVTQQDWADRLEAALTGADGVPSDELVAIHGEKHAAAYEECGHWRCQRRPAATPRGSHDGTTI